MSHGVPPNPATDMALELSPARPEAFYGLDAAAELAGVSRRVLLGYCRAGLVRPVLQPPYGRMEFTDAAIHAVRRLERFRTARGLDVGWLKTVAALIEEVERLRAELRFWRGC